MADIDTSISTFISQLPKVELHVHIEGTLSPSLRWRLAQKNQIPLPKYPTYEFLVASYATMYNHRREIQGDNGLPTFLEAYYGGMEVLRTEEDFYDLAMEYFTKAADMNIRYADPFFDPQAHTRRRVALAAVMNGLERAKRDALEGGFGGVFHAVGLDSNEYDRPPSLFQDVLAQARKDGYWITAHCDVGQKNTHEHIREVATSCVGGFEGADRIDHGLNAIERPELIQIIKQRGLGLTLCPHAYHRRLPTEYVFGSIKKLWDEGVRITIASDDPTYMHQRWVQENLELVMHYCGFNSRDMVRLQKNGVDISWAAEDVKERIRKELDSVERPLTW
ncbi:related to adenine deaminase/adenosine deaminase [Armillaria ostoyae]|uniref:Related to adenine deaminase/adenosine deaminase n=1 Tax=Armillaria ostoyae TaxID=47428 RepID=A0A284RQX1_ARMOS|nr:related to adenine deaminase/adenosine deaminase [Armillaria ostoyae]